MRISGRKLEFEGMEFEEISKAQDRAIDMVKKHLAEPLKTVEAMGYSRLEMALAYFSLAYHALRFGRSEEAANREYPIFVTRPL